jgi:Recombination enhancement, RecA-dependent nuclease
MTKLEELRIQQMMRLGCVVCAFLEIPYPAQECHHLLHGNRRMGDWFTIPLCRGHHQGDFTAEQKEVLAQHQLVAISSGRKAFTRVYPDERLLWELTQERLGLMWPIPKIVPRHVA